jgi:hypothetical protein
LDPFLGASLASYGDLKNEVKRKKRAGEINWEEVVTKGDSLCIGGWLCSESQGASGEKSSDAEA